MSKGRLSSPKRKSRRTSGAAKPSAIGRAKNVHRFVGVSLSGGRADRTSVAILEYFPEQKRLFLVKLVDKIRGEEFISADLKLHEILLQYAEHTEFVAFDAPLSLPKCIRCKLKCPGYETCSEPEIKWLHDLNHAQAAQKKPRKIFTPYTQRCVDAYFLHNEEENFEVQHALGSNLAPLAARAHFIQRRLDLECIEVITRIAVWRIGLWCKMNKSQLRSFRSSIGGDQARKIFLDQVCQKLGVFIYEQDLKILIDNHHAFEAFVCGLVGYYKFIGKVQPRPKGFPKSEGWVTLPT